MIVFLKEAKIYIGPGEKDRNRSDFQQALCKLLLVDMRIFVLIYIQFNEWIYIINQKKSPTEVELLLSRLFESI